MGVGRAIQTNFTAGIYGMLLDGHIDAPRRNNALSDSQNVHPMPQGPLVRRSGTAMEWPLRDMTQRSELFPFVYNRQQHFQIEMGAGYFRFHVKSGPITLPGVAVTGVTQASPAVVTTSGTPPTAGQHITLAGVGGMVQVNGREFLVGAVSGSTFQILNPNGTNFDTTAMPAYTSGGQWARIYEVTGSPYTQADLFDSSGLFVPWLLNIGDVTFICHKTYSPRALVRNGTTNWVLNTPQLVDGPYLNINPTATTLTAGGGAAGSTGNTVTASSIVGINGGIGFQGTDVGRLIRLKNGSNWAWGVITAVASTTSITITNSSTSIALPSAAINNWRLGAFGNTPGIGWPGKVEVVEDRLVFSDVPGANGKTFSTQIGGYSPTQLFSEPTSSDGTVNPDDGIVAAARSAETVQWMKAVQEGLLIGTGKGENILSGTSIGDALTPQTARVRPSTNEGGAPIQAIATNDSVIFTQATRLQLVSTAYQLAQNGFSVENLSIFATHLTAAGIARTAWQPKPFPICWVACDDGSLVAVTIDKPNNILAWQRHVLGGYSDAGQTLPPVVESISVIPSDDGRLDEVWLIVRRWINGAVARYIEVINPLFPLTGQIQNAFFQDAGLTYNGTPTGTLYGLWHLEGQTVRLLVDGKSHPPLVVTGGSVTLANNRKGSVIQVGLPTEWFAVTLKPEGASNDGSAQGKPKIWNRLIFRLFNTLGLSYGGTVDDHDDFPFNNLTAFDQQPTLFSGDTEEVAWPESIETGAEIFFGHDGPFPATVLAVFGTLETTDDE